MQRLLFLVLAAALSVSVFSLALSQHSGATQRSAASEISHGSDESKPQLKPRAKPLEALYAIERRQHSVVVSVLSNGCTNADSFVVSQSESQISVIRKQADRCRRRPFIRQVELPVGLAKTPLQLRNPLIAADTPLQP